MFTTAELLQLIDAIYAGVLGTAAWEAAIGVWCRALGGEGAVLELRYACSHDLDTVAFINIDQGYQRTYAELTRLPDMNGAFRAIAASASLGGITSDQLALVAPDLERSRFRDEWQRPQQVSDLVAVPLAPNPFVTGGLFFGRSRRSGGYGDRELEALRTLRPHLLRAIQIRQRLQHLESAAQEALAALELVEQGVVLVDSQATVVHANRAAGAVLGQGDGIGATRAVLTCDGVEDTQCLHRLVGEAAMGTNGAGGPLAVRRRSGRRPLSILVAPLRGELPVGQGPPATAIVLIADPELGVVAPGALLRQLYGLTAAEARTADALLDHERLADVAGRLGVSLATVRTLLQRAFDKTDTHSQAELVRLMLAHRLPTGAQPAS